MYQYVSACRRLKKKITLKLIVFYICAYYNNSSSMHFSRLFGDKFQISRTQIKVLCHIRENEVIPYTVFCAIGWPICFISVGLRFWSLSTKSFTFQGLPQLVNHPSVPLMFLMFLPPARKSFLCLSQDSLSFLIVYSGVP